MSELMLAAVLRQVEVMGVSEKEPSLSWMERRKPLSGGLDTLTEKWIWELINASLASYFFLAQTLLVS